MGQTGLVGWHSGCFVGTVPEMSPLPIVIMLTSFDVGGTERQTVELVRRLDPGRFHVHVACFHKRGGLLRNMPPSIPVEVFPVHGFRNPASVRQWLRFASWCRQADIKLVHTCDMYANLFGLTAAAFAGVPARIGSRRDVNNDDKTRLQQAGQRVAYRTAHAVVANSTACAEHLKKEGVPEDSIRLIPNGVDTAVFAAPRARRALRRIVTVANLRPEKGHDVLVDAAPQILAAHPDAEFLIAGSGPRASQIAARAAARGVSDRFHFLGECSDIPQLLAESDIFALPSRSEGLPNAVMEAMAAGLPVVATRVGGIPELIASGVTGTIVPPGDSRAMASAVVDLMNDPDRAATLGEHARLRAQNEYGFARMVASTEQRYLTEIERHQTSAALEVA
jgi:glycosyltransferase involved in cell wall biosynthesis